MKKLQEESIEFLLKKKKFVEKKELVDLFKQVQTDYSNLRCYLRENFPALMGIMKPFIKKNILFTENEFYILKRKKY